MIDPAHGTSSALPLPGPGSRIGRAGAAGPAVRTTGPPDPWAQDVLPLLARHIRAELAVVEESVAAAATTQPVRRTLLEHLAQNHDALHSGASDAPVALSRLVQQLRARGVEGLRAPACGACGREMELKYRVDGGRMCLRCFRHHTAKPCARCGKTAPVATRTADGQPLCGTCHTVLEECSSCGRPRRVAMRTADRAALCKRCAPRPERVCTGCGRLAPPHSTKGSGPLCDRCYTKPPRQCGICEVVGPIALRAADGGVDVCDRCYAHPIPPCRDCGERRDCGHDLPPDSDSAPDEPSSTARLRRLRRLRARAAPERECVLCGEFTKVQVKWPLGAVCKRCYHHRLEAPSLCAGCGCDAVLIGERDGRACCGPCAGVILDYRCPHCQQPGRGYHDGSCARCHLQQRLIDVLGPPSDSSAVKALRVWLETDMRPKSAIYWLARPGRADILRQLASRSTPAHADLDEFPRTMAMDYLRAVLVSLEVLPRRNEPLERAVGWLDDQLRQAPTSHRRLIRPYAEWVLLRRARRSVRRGKFSEGSAKYLRMRVSAALRFLDWLDDQSIPLTEAGQQDLDRYLAQGSTTRYLIRDFLVWTSNAHESVRLSVPERRQLSAVEPFDERVRTQHLHKALDTADLDLAARVAAVFVLLYGQHLSRVVTWRTDRINERDGQTTFRFDQIDVPLAEPFAAMISDLVKHQGHSASSHESRWLFPGRYPGEHAQSGHLARKLGAHGIHLRRARNTALAELATDLPAPVLADLLGMHIFTAVAWVKSMQRDWHDFIAETRQHSRGLDLARTRPSLGLQEAHE